MSDIKVVTFSITTDASGDWTDQCSHISGRILQYRYDPDDTSPLDTGADLDIVGDRSGVVVADHDNLGTSALTRAPRQPTHAADGSASLYASTGEPVEDYIWVHETLTATIANGGNAKSGTLYVYIG